MELQELDAETLGALVTGSREEVADYLSDAELPLGDMEALRQAESAGRARDRVLQMIDDHLVAATVARELDVAERDVADVKSIIDRVADLEEVDGDLPDEYDTLDQDAVLDLMGGTIDDMRTFLEEHALSASQLAYLLEAEQKVKDRKTAKRMLRDAMHDQVLAEDMARVKEDIDSLRTDMSDLEADAAGNIDPGQVDAARVDADEVIDYEAVAQKNIDDVKEAVRTRDLDLAELLAAERAGRDRPRLKEWLQDRMDGEGSAGAEADDGQAEDGTGDQDGDRPDTGAPDGDADADEADDGQAEDGTDEREALIDDLVERFDYPRSRFDGMTMDDLRKIHDNLGGDAAADGDADEPGDGTEMREDIDTTDLTAMAEQTDDEAERGAAQGKDLMSQLDLIDLKKNFGGQSEDEEPEEDEADEEVAERGLVSRIAGQVRGHVDRAATGGLAETARQDLERAQDLDDDHRAALLIAHVMKQFLEVNMGIQRELTYLEVAAELEKSDIDTAYEDDIREFYQRMHLQEYKGEAAVDVDEAHDLAERVISDLS